MLLSAAERLLLLCGGLGGPCAAADNGPAVWVGPQKKLLLEDYPMYGQIHPALRHEWGQGWHSCTQANTSASSCHNRLFTCRPRRCCNTQPEHQHLIWRLVKQTNTTLAMHRLEPG